METKGVQALRRVVELVGVLVIAAFVVVPALPGSWTGGLSPMMAGWLRQISVKQSWRMYAPNPQRAQTYMNLTAEYPDGTERELEETLQERQGWGTHWMWDKTRVDIWRHYANFHPRRRNEHRTWYLRGVCVREARRGPIPEKIVMYQVTRRFAPPDKVRQGSLGLGRPRRHLVTVQYCKTKDVLRMIAEDRKRRGVADETEVSRG